MGWGPQQLQQQQAAATSAAAAAAAGGSCPQVGGAASAAPAAGAAARCRSRPLALFLRPHEYTLYVTEVLMYVICILIACNSRASAELRLASVARLI